MASLRPDQPQVSPYTTFALNLASNKNLPMVLNAGSTAQTRRRQSAPSTATPSTTIECDYHPQADSDGYQSSDDSLYLAPSARQRRARANASYIPPLPGHSASPAADSVGAYSCEAPSISIRRVPRRDSDSSVSSAFSWQESIFHVRRLSDAHETQAHATKAHLVEQVARSLVPPPPQGLRPHPNPLRSNPVFGIGWI